MKFRGGWLGTKFGTQVAELDKISGAATTAADAETSLAVKEGVSPVIDEKTPETPAEDLSGDSDEETRKSLQYGVQVAEATLKVWTPQHLIAAYVLMWIVNFVQAFTSGVNSTLSVYVTSAFAAHSLTATTSIVSSLLAGLIKLPYAKFLDIFGRPLGFFCAFSCMTLGLVMMAGCRNVYTYAAAQCFYSVGYNCIDFTVTIFIADTSKLKNRAFWIAYSATPYLITTWVYGPACESLLNTIGWRWGLGIWAIIFPVVCSPLCALFYYNQRKAEKAGLVRVPEHARGVVQNVLYYLKEFDLAGLLILSTGLALFLLAFNLEPKQGQLWKSPLVICFLIFGGLLIGAFAVWERFFAPVTFIPWHLLRNRTVFFTYTMMGALYTPWYIWDSYFYSLNIVVFNQSITNATYIGNIYTVGSTFWSLVMGVVILYNGRLKWQAVYFGVPMSVLGVALMIHFREPGVGIGYIVMCQIFVAVGGGTLVICEQMTVMAVSAHENIPAVLAVEGLVASVAGSIGSAIAGAMWQNIFPKQLAKNLPASAQANLNTIYEDIDTQTSYPFGSPTRDAINLSYGNTQKIMLITATCLYAMTWGSTMMWEDINVKNIKQREGLMI